MLQHVIGVMEDNKAIQNLRNFKHKFENFDIDQKRPKL